MLRTIFLTVLCISSALGNLLEKPVNLPCNLDDSKCITDITQWLYNSATSTNLDKKYENLDPMFLDKVEAVLGYMNFTLENLNVEGFKTCRVQETSLNLDLSSMQIDLMCLRIHLDGDYDCDGMLTTVPIKGRGDFWADYTNYRVILDTNIAFYKKGNNIYLKHEPKLVKAELFGNIDFELRNLFDGDKKLSDNVHSFGKNNPKLFTSLVHDPFFKLCSNKIIKKLNKLYDEVPITELLQVNEASLKIGNI